MEDIIRQVYAQWRVAKEQARQECDSRSLPNMAEKYRMCDMFKGTEDLQSLIRLFTSPQGMEFCIKHRFPNIATFRLFKPFRKPSTEASCNQTDLEELGFNWIVNLNLDPTKWFMGGAGTDKNDYNNSVLDSAGGA